MEKKLKILHLEDSSSDAELVKRVLKKSSINYDILLVDCKIEFIKALDTFSPDIILSDHSLPSFNSHEALSIIKSKGNKVPFILITANVSEEFAVDVIGRGADDYILKDRLERLPTAITNALIKYNLEQQREIYITELIKKEKRYSALIENSADAVVILGLDGKPNYVSSSIQRVLGYNEQEAMQLSFFEILHPEDIEHAQTVFADCLSKPELPIKGSTSRIKHKNGNWVWLESTITNMLHDPDINGIVDNFRDISDRKLAEDKIKHANRLYAFIGQINQAIVHVIDDQTLMNEACKIAIEVGKFKMAWIGLADVENHKVRLVASYGATNEEKLLFKNYDYDCGGPIEKVLNGLDYCVVSNIKKELSTAWVNIAVNSGFNSAIVLAIKKSGKIIGAFNIYSTEANFFDQEEIELLTKATDDISFALEVFEKEKLRTLAEKALKRSETKLKESESYLQAYTKELVISNTELEQFSYIISHNLRAPVANIMGLAEEMKDTSHSTEVREMLSAALTDSIKMLDDVTIDLNTILKVKREITEKKEVVNLTDLITSIQTDLQNQIQIEKVHINLDCENVNELFTLKSYLYSIFYNLISNSIKYCQPGTPSIIEIASELCDKQLTITFRDNGMGIDMAKRKDQVFGLYKRFHHHVEGKGMGLFMVKTQVETLGGKITIDSVVNKGTEFKIVFPE